MDASTVRDWLADIGWETLLNRRGTTWRQIPQSRREGLNAEKALALIVEHPTLIKRPVLQHDGGLLVGFDAERYSATLK